MFSLEAYKTPSSASTSTVSYSELESYTFGEMGSAFS